MNERHEDRQWSRGGALLGEVIRFRRRTARSVACGGPVLLVSLVLTGGCGHSAARHVPIKAPGDADASVAKALDAIPAADRVAFSAITAGSGALARIAALAQASDRVTPHNVAVLRAFRPVIVALGPRDAVLARLRVRLLGALDVVARTAAGRVTGRAWLASATAIVEGLAGYGRRHPGILGLIRD